MPIKIATIEEPNVGRYGQWRRPSEGVKMSTVISCAVTFERLYAHIFERMYKKKSFPIVQCIVEYGNALTGELSGFVERGMVAHDYADDVSNYLIITEQSFPRGRSIPINCVLQIRDIKGKMLWQHEKLREEPNVEETTTNAAKPKSAKAGGKTPVSK